MQLGFLVGAKYVRSAWPGPPDASMYHGPHRGRWTFPGGLRSRRDQFGLGHTRVARLEARRHATIEFPFDRRLGAVTIYTRPMRSSASADAFGKSEMPICLSS